MKIPMMCDMKNFRQISPDKSRWHHADVICKLFQPTEVSEAKNALRNYDKAGAFSRAGYRLYKKSHATS